MATFVSTTLGKRTGSTTTVFLPVMIEPNRVGKLYPGGATLSGISPELRVSTSTNSGARRTRVRVTIPQLETEGGSLDRAYVKSRPFGEISLYIPEGTLQTDVNDIVGYLSSATSSGLVNLNDILVNGIAVY